MAPSQRNKSPAGNKSNKASLGLVNLQQVRNKLGMSLVLPRLIPIQASRLTFWLLIMNLMKSHSKKR